ncbi:MAG: hypothetical protein AB7D27_02790 [Desulfomicrobium sp.]
MNTNNETIIELRNDFKISIDLEYADQLFFKFDSDIELFFNNLDVSQRSFEESAQELSRIFMNTLSDNIVFIYEQVEAGFLYQIEYGHDFWHIHQSAAFDAVNNLVWKYFGSEEEDYEMSYFFEFDFVSNDSIFIKRNIEKNFYSVPKTSYVLDICYDEYVDAYSLEINKNSLAIAFDLCGLGVELAILDMIVRDYNSYQD